MRFKTIPVYLSLIAFATISLAQTKISGTVQCGKSDEQHALEVGDHPGHSLMISKGRCTWTKPMDIAGTQTKEDLGTNFDEVHGNKSQGHGYVGGTMANGDKMYVRIQGSSTLKDSVVDSAEGAWSFTGGTGKLKGVKGKGTYKGNGAPQSRSDLFLQTPRKIGDPGLSEATLCSRDTAFLSRSIVEGGASF